MSKKMLEYVPSWLISAICVSLILLGVSVLLLGRDDVWPLSLKTSDPPAFFLLTVYWVLAILALVMVMWQRDSAKADRFEAQLIKRYAQMEELCIALNEILVSLKCERGRLASGRGHNQLMSAIADAMTAAISKLDSRPHGLADALARALRCVDEIAPPRSGGDTYDERHKHES